MFKKKHKICQTTDIVAVTRSSKGRNKDCGPDDICPECLAVLTVKIHLSVVFSHIAVLSLG